MTKYEQMTLESIPIERLAELTGLFQPTGCPAFTWRPDEHEARMEVIRRYGASMAIHKKKIASVGTTSQNAEPEAVTREEFEAMRRAAPSSGR